MDFHSLSRRDLQSLCKKNRIPANMTNVAMADALQALQNVEGIDDIKEVSQFQSPKKAEGRSPDLPHTTRRASARRAPIQDETKEQGSPLPRSRRVTVKTSEIMKMVAEGEDEKVENPDEMPKTPAVPTGRKPRVAPNTRRKASKKKDEGKEEDEKQEGPKEIPATPASGNGRSTRKRGGKNEEKEGCEGRKEMANTPATRCGQRTSTRRAATTPVAGEEKAAGTRTTRRARHPLNKQMEEIAADATADVGRRSTRSKASVKMAALAQEEEKKEEGEVEETKDSLDPEEEADVKPMDLTGAISDLCDRFSEAKMEGSDGAQGPIFEGEDSQQEAKSAAESADSGQYQLLGEITVKCYGETIQEAPVFTVEEENPNAESSSKLQELEDEQTVDGVQQQEQESDQLDALPGLQESPVRGLVSYEQHSGEGDREKDLNWIEIIVEEDRTPIEKLKSLDGAPKENPTAVDGGFDPDGEEEEKGKESGDLDFPVQDSYLWGGTKIPASGGDPLRIRGAGDHISPATEDLIVMEEETSLIQPLEFKDSGEPQPVNQLLKAQISSPPQADPPTADAVAGFYCEIPACDNHVSGEFPPETDKPVDDDDIEAKESSNKVPIGGQPALESRSILESTTSSVLQKIPSPYPIVESSDAAISPAEASAEFGDLIGERPDLATGSPAKTSSHLADLIGDGSIVGSPEKFSARIGDSIKESEEKGDLAKAIGDSPASFVGSPVETSLAIGIQPEFGLVTGAPAASPSVSVDDEAKGFVLEAAGSEKNSKGSAGIYRSEESGDRDDDKENAGATGLTVLTEAGAGGGEAKAKQMAVDLNSLSLRKLKAIYKEAASKINEVKGKRSALIELDENRL